MLRKLRVGNKLENTRDRERTSGAFEEGAVRELYVEFIGIDGGGTVGTGGFGVGDGADFAVDF